MLKRFGVDYLIGMLGALAFPLVLAPLSPQPLLEILPRELFSLLEAAWLYHLAVQSHVSLRHRLWRSYSVALGFFSVLIHWLYITMVYYGEMPVAAAVFCLTLLIAVCALFYLPLPLLVAPLLWAPAWQRRFSFATAVAVTEYWRGEAFFGFPWGLWGYAWARWAPVRSLASGFGVYGIGFAVAWLASLWRDHGRRALVGCMLQTSAVLLLGYGLWQSNLQTAGIIGRRTIGIVQGNFSHALLNAAAPPRYDIAQAYWQQGKHLAAQGAEVVVWPEGAWPYGLMLEGNTPTPRLPSLAPAALLTGIDIAEAHPNGLRMYNSAIWVDPQGTLQGRYDKRHLVPFGEYMPYRWLLPFDTLVPNLPADFTSGLDHRPIGPHAYGVLICFDGVFPELSRKTVALGARLLVNLTTDTWYGVSSAPYQHRDFYRLRAAETNRAVVRATNSGISTFISDSGETLQSSPLFVATHLQATISERQNLTWYVRWGEAPIGVACLIVLACYGLRCCTKKC